MNLTTHRCPQCGHTYHTTMPPTITVKCKWDGHPTMEIINND